MKLYLFQFGYQTATQLRRWKEDEDSGAVFIDAPNAEEALRWGLEVAAECVNRVFGVKWSRKYAAWVEENWQTKYTTSELEGIPRIRCGEMPTFEHVFSRT